MKIEMIKVKGEYENFLIGKYQVTQKEWKEIMDINPSTFVDDNRPVENVSWYDAIDFCNRLSVKEGLTPVYKIKGSTDPDEWGEYFDDKASFHATAYWDADGYRLPTKEEWRYAAQGGNNSRGYKYSGSNDIDEIAWYWDNAENKTQQVGTKKPNELGLYDMAGNVWEWCWDIWRENVDDLVSRLLLGGSWHSGDSECEVLHRFSVQPSRSGANIGFRLCRNIKQGD